MSPDPLRADTTVPPNVSSGAERDAKIEQLLLAGLDHYFAAQYEQAINIWTRALFFDRSHPRARAYIDRARRAQAERQRESEELLHNGAIAYRRGDGREARRLLQAALDAGAPFEDTFPMLERLNQLDAATPQPSLSRTQNSLATERAALEPHRRRWLSTLVAGVALLALAAAGGYAVISSRVEWTSLSSLAGARHMSSSAMRETTFTVPTSGELALAGARKLVARGDLRGALNVLERVRPTDPQKSDADRLRGDLQRQLLHDASDGPQTVAPRDPAREPRP